MKSVLKFFSIAISILAIGGCETMAVRDDFGNPITANNNGFTVAVNSLGVGSPTTFDIAPLNKGVSAKDLQFLEYSRYLQRALESKGYRKTDLKDRPEILILLGYSISDGETRTSSVDVPQWGQTGTMNLGTTGTISTIGNTSFLNAQTTSIPTYGVTGSRTVTSQYTTFTRKVQISAMALEDVREVWQTTIASIGSSGDLRRVFPVLIAAGKDYLGSPTSRAKTIRIAEESPQVMSIR
jgi:hypothetical protein